MGDRAGLGPALPEGGKEIKPYRLQRGYAYLLPARGFLPRTLEEDDNFRLVNVG